MIHESTELGVFFESFASRENRATQRDCRKTISEGSRLGRWRIFQKPISFIPG